MTDKTLQNVLDAIAREGFRDIADYDYVSARVNFRLNLREQFYWSALQATEKLLKAILLFNQQKVKGLRHFVVKAYERIKNDTAVPLNLDKDQRQFLAMLEEFGNNRYRTSYTRIIGDELPKVDCLIWTIRHYARSPRLEVEGIDKTEWVLKNWHAPKLCDAPVSMQISGGELEKVLSRDTSDELRQGLVWCNHYYGGPENARQTPAMVYSSSQSSIYERIWISETKVQYSKSLADALQDFVSFPKA